MLTITPWCAKKQSFRADGLNVRRMSAAPRSDYARISAMPGRWSPSTCCFACCAISIVDRSRSTCATSPISRRQRSWKAIDEDVDIDSITKAPPDGIMPTYVAALNALPPSQANRAPLRPWMRSLHDRAADPLNFAWRRRESRSLQRAGDERLRPALQGSLDDMIAAPGSMSRPTEIAADFCVVETSAPQISRLGQPGPRGRPGGIECSAMAGELLGGHRHPCRRHRPSSRTMRTRSPRAAAPRHGR